MKNILVGLLLIVVNMYALSKEQKDVARFVYEKGKPFDLGYTLVAIAWQESKLGKYPINLSDPSCGIMHVMPRFLIKRTKMKDTLWNRSRLCERLISDKSFSIAAAILELKYWQNYWKSRKVNRVWSHMVASYNQGFACDINSEYVKSIRKYIKRLRDKKEVLAIKNK